ncbi:phosphatase PAP2 family protein [Butyrivibrio sp. AE2032]|uniref:phosphatase PAP2 family protein n=1 Tax=Butyrivibrio sp. AE2032 TaxID=1458463 RepID=UPI0005543CF0|nr:phosphatase PAP2 family protein [Butyrivibrio sp. AE2032]
METKNGNKLTRAFMLLGVTVIFSLLTFFVDRQPVGLEGTSVGFANLNSTFAGRFGYNAAMGKISDVAMIFAFLVVAFFAAMGLKMLIKEKSLSKVDKVIIGLGVLYVVVAVLYVVFSKVPINYRPVMKPGETELETSFPSTHTLIIGTVLGSGILAVKRLFKDEKITKTVTIVFSVIIVVGIAARLFSGVHWVTDILAGILFSMTLVSFYAAWCLD